MNKSIYFTLMTSLIGNYFYIFFCSVVLLDLGYSSAAIGSFVAITIIPNLIFGPALGRFVDMFPKRTLHTYLCLGLALILLLFNFVAKNVSIQCGNILLPIIMVLYNFLFSPLNTLLYQYVIPSLDVEEKLSYNRWERYQACGTMVASLIGFIIIKVLWVDALLWIDAATFLLSAIVIHKGWSFSEAKHDMALISKKKIGLWHFKSTLISGWVLSVLGFAVLSCLAFVFCIDSHDSSIGILFFKEFNVNIEYIPLLTCFFGTINLFGTFLYQKYFSCFDSTKIQIYALLHLCVSLIFIALGISLDLAILALCGLIFIQVVEPIWSTSNTVIIRTQIRAGHYGEFFGYFRILRSLVTSLGIFLYGWAQDLSMLSYLVWLQCVLILLPILAKFLYEQFKIEIDPDNKNSENEPHTSSFSSA